MNMTTSQDIANIRYWYRRPCTETPATLRQLRHNATTATPANATNATTANATNATTANATPSNATPTNATPTTSGAVKRAAEKTNTLISFTSKHSKLEHVESTTIGQKEYFYYEDEVSESEAFGIIFTERVWTQRNGAESIFGVTFLRPFQIKKSSKRKCFGQEIFSTKAISILQTKLRGKCFVMSAEDFIKFTPQGFDKKDVYVCGYQYSKVTGVISKIKPPATNSAKMLTREVALKQNDCLVFREYFNKLNRELAEKKKTNLQLAVNNPEAEYKNRVVKTGDKVYVATQSGKKSIEQNRSIWKAKVLDSFFRGQYFKTTTEVPGTSARSVYRKEKLSTVQDTSPMLAIVGRNSVSEYPEHSTFRPTEIAESDEFACESTYDELKKQIPRNHPDTGLRKLKHSQLVTQDAINHSKRPIAPAKEYKCSWNDCIFQFADRAQYIDHCIGKGAAASDGHVQYYYRDLVKGDEYVCLWRGCIRPVFRKITQLINHITDEHTMKECKNCVT